MEAKLKSIEEKLDIIIAAMSVNPEFEKYVKEGMLKLHMVKFEKELRQADADMISKKKKFIIDNLQHGSIQFTPMGAIAYFGHMGFAPKPDAPQFVREFIDKAANQVELLKWDISKWSFDDFVQEILSNNGFCPLTKIKLNSTFGEAIDIPIELEKERLKYLEENP